MKVTTETKVIDVISIEITKDFAEELLEDLSSGGYDRDHTLPLEKLYDALKEVLEND